MDIKDFNLYQNLNEFLIKILYYLKSKKYWKEDSYEQKLYISNNFTSLSVIVVSGCTSQSNNSSTSGNSILIQNSSFSPSILNVPVGTTVTWINKVNKTQKIVSSIGVFSSKDLTNGMSYNYTFNKIGSYPFHSSVNSSMTGTIIVYSSNSTSNSSSSGIKY